MAQYPNLRSFTLGLHLDRKWMLECGENILQSLLQAFTLPGKADDYLAHLQELILHLDLEHTPGQSLFNEQSPNICQLWNSFQEALLNIVTQLHLPGVWIQCRTSNTRFSKCDASTRTMVENHLKVLMDSKRLLWRDATERRWPLML